MFEDVERRRLPLPERGVEIALLDWGGSGPLALLHHANGFCAALWQPVAERLREHFHVVAMDARGHGDSSRPRTEGAYRWSELAKDWQAVAERLVERTGEERVALALGHSFGGTLSLLGAAERPDLVASLVLVDPVIRPEMDAETAARLAHTVGLAERTRRRRHRWPSRAEARLHLAGRELFASWQPRALDLYVDEGLVEDGADGVTLKCPREVEAAVFEGSGELDLEREAARVEAPTLFLWARNGNFPRAGYERIVSRMPRARIDDVDAGHLVPMEDPDVVTDAAIAFASTSDGAQGAADKSGAARS